MLLSPTAARAFQLPPATKATDPEERKFWAAQQNPEPNQQLSPAFQALNTNDMESLQAMADAGWALPEIADDAGRTMLHRAAMIGDAEAVSFMIKQGSKLDAYSKFQETPLHLAIRNNRLACVKVLVEAGASTSLKYGTKDDTALTLAERYQVRPIAEYLKSKGATGDKVEYPCLAGPGQCFYRS